MAVIVYIHHFDCLCTLKGSRTLGSSSVNEISCYCPGGWPGNILCLSVYKCCHGLGYGSMRLSATHITEDAGLKIVDAPLMRMFRMGQGGYRHLLFL